MPQGLIVAEVDVKLPSNLIYKVVLAVGVTHIGLSLRVPSNEPGAQATLANVVNLSAEIKLIAQS